MKTFHNLFLEIISLDNLLVSWEEFTRGKKSKPDVQAFSFRLMDNIIQLHDDLASKTYKHDSYYAFHIGDPKPRHIHKASVRDRVLHRAVYRVLYSVFDPTFISDSFSCRKGKGSHAAMKRFQQISYQVTQNHTRTAWVMKCDIRKFFANIDQSVLLHLLEKRIIDQQALWLFVRILESFDSGDYHKGLPLGNITSQLFANVYMNELDQFVKHELKVKHYIRYADDFVFLSQDHDQLLKVLPQIQDFPWERLRLSVHPDKIVLKTVASGIDFLGFVHFPHHRVIRTTTRRRMMRKIQKKPLDPTLQSYLGLMRHGNTYKQQKEALNWYWINQQQ